MDALFTAIETSIEQENWHAAIALSLTIPDICARLEDPRNKSKGAYIGWFERHLQSTYESRYRPEPFINAADFYALRCAFLHAGVDELTQQPVRDRLSRIRFSTVGPHIAQINDVLVLHPRNFCQEVLAAARAWSGKVAQDASVLARMNALAAIEHEAFSPVDGFGI